MESTYENLMNIFYGLENVYFKNFKIQTQGFEIENCVRRDWHGKQTGTTSRGGLLNLEDT